MNFFWGGREEKKDGGGGGNKIDAKQGGEDPCGDIAHTSTFDLFSLPTTEASAFYDQLNKEIEGLRAKVDSQLREMVEASRKDISVLETKLKEIQTNEISTPETEAAQEPTRHAPTSPLHSTDSNVTEPIANLSRLSTSRRKGEALSPSEDAKLIGIVKIGTVLECREDDDENDENVAAVVESKAVAQDRILQTRRTPDKTIHVKYDNSSLYPNTDWTTRTIDSLIMIDTSSMDQEEETTIRTINSSKSGTDAIDKARKSRSSPTLQNFGSTALYSSFPNDESYTLGKQECTANTTTAGTSNLKCIRNQPSLIDAFSEELEESVEGSEIIDEGPIGPENIISLLSDVTDNGKVVDGVSKKRIEADREERSKFSDDYAGLDSQDRLLISRRTPDSSGLGFVSNSSPRTTKETSPPHFERSLPAMKSSELSPKEKSYLEQGSRAHLIAKTPLTPESPRRRETSPPKRRDPPIERKKVPSNPFYASRFRRAQHEPSDAEAERQTESMLRKGGYQEEPAAGETVRRREPTPRKANHTNVSRIASSPLSNEEEVLRPSSANKDKSQNHFSSEHGGIGNCRSQSLSPAGLSDEEHGRPESAPPIISYISMARMQHSFNTEDETEMETMSPRGSAKKVPFPVSPQLASKLEFFRSHYNANPENEQKLFPPQIHSMSEPGKTENHADDDGEISGEILHSGCRDVHREGMEAYSVYNADHVDEKIQRQFSRSSDYDCHSQECLTRATDELKVTSKPWRESLQNETIGLPQENRQDVFDRSDVTTQTQALPQESRGPTDHKQDTQLSTHEKGHSEQTKRRNNNASCSKSQRDHKDTMKTKYSNSPPHQDPYIQYASEEQEYLRVPYLEDDPKTERGNGTRISRHRPELGSQHPESMSMKNRYRTSTIENEPIDDNVPKNSREVKRRNSKVQSNKVRRTKKSVDKYSHDDDVMERRIDEVRYEKEISEKGKLNDPKNSGGRYMTNKRSASAQKKTRDKSMKKHGRRSHMDPTAKHVIETCNDQYGTENSDALVEWTSSEESPFISSPIELKQSRSASQKKATILRGNEYGEKRMTHTLESNDDGYNTEISAALVKWSPPQETPVEVDVLTTPRQAVTIRRQPSPERLMRTRTIVAMNPVESLKQERMFFRPSPDARAAKALKSNKKKKVKNLSVETEQPSSFSRAIVPHVGSDVVAVPKAKHYSHHGTTASDNLVSISKAVQNGQMVVLKQVQGKLIKDPYGDSGRYTGILLDDLPHGEGTMHYSDGRSYIGEWRHGRWHGHGRAKFVNGDVYIGKYERDRRDGRGRYEWADGRVYDGEFTRNQRNGHGYYTWPDGASYVGEFMDGQRHGEGSYKFADGSVYKGEWQNGKYDGVGECVWSSGRKYHGEWRNGQASGYGVEFRADGTIRHQGEWKKDRPVRKRKDP